MRRLFVISLVAVAHSAAAERHPVFSFVVTLAFAFQHPRAAVFFALSLHDALPICRAVAQVLEPLLARGPHALLLLLDVRTAGEERDRKSTRLNSSHGSISYAVFCLKKKNKCADSS